ncbi:MAG: hypothetical protein HQK60_03230 [Deltaproteobacteria bacterium]|nr:hypothetical protein [Deltaproteobacteria bacterium]
MTKGIVRPIRAAEYTLRGLAISVQASVVIVGDLNWKIQGIGDFNGDKAADILWRHAVSGEVYLWTMNGVAISAQASVVTIGDLN